MKYAIETLEIEANKLKEIIRVEEKYRVYPEYIHTHTEFKERLVEVLKSIDILQQAISTSKENKENSMEIDFGTGSEKIKFEDIKTWNYVVGINDAGDPFYVATGQVFSSTGGGCYGNFTKDFAMSCQAIEAFKTASPAKCFIKNGYKHG